MESECLWKKRVRAAGTAMYRGGDPHAPRNLPAHAFARGLPPSDSSGSSSESEGEATVPRPAPLRRQVASKTLALVEASRREGARRAAMPEETLRECLRFLGGNDRLAFGAASRRSKRAARHGASWDRWVGAAHRTPVPPPERGDVARRGPKRKRRARGSFRALVAARREDVAAALRSAAKTLHDLRGARETRHAKQRDVAARLSLDLQTIRARRRELAQHREQPQAAAKRRLALLGQRGAFEAYGPRAFSALATAARRQHNVYFDGVCKKEIEHLQKTICSLVGAHDRLKGELRDLDESIPRGEARARRLNDGAACLARLLARLG